MTPLVKTTWTYKRVGDLTLEADVHAQGDLDGEPTVVWLHGGALILEHRDTVPAWLFRACSEIGAAVISIDYRLAPETKLPDIIADVEDAFAWLGGRGLEPPRAARADRRRRELGRWVPGARRRVPRSATAAAIVSLWGYGT
jgi:acetyl esterase/lipase